MEKEYFFKTDHLVIWRPVGAIDVDKIREFIVFLNQQSSKSDLQFDRFIDLSKINGISVNYEELSGIADQRSEYASKHLGKKVKMAMFVTHPLSFGMARMYENLLDNAKFEINIYYSIEEASKFLDVDLSLLKE